MKPLRTTVGTLPLFLACALMAGCPVSQSTIGGSPPAASGAARKETHNEVQGQTAGPSRMPGRSQQARAAQKATEAGNRPILVIEGDPKGQADLVKGIGAGDPQALFSPEAGLNLTGIEEAGVVFAAANSHPPGALSELQPFCFSWPRIPGDQEGGLVQLATASDKVAQENSWSTDNKGHGKMAIALGPDGVIATVPYIAPVAEGSAPTQFYGARLLSWRLEMLDLQVGSTASPLTSVPVLTDTLVPAERNDILFDYLKRTTKARDVRVRAAQRAISRLIQEAARRSAALPATLEQAERHGAASLIQVSHVSPENADLVVEFDGVQAYRYTFKLESGEVGRVISYYFAVHPMDAANVYAPEGQVNDPDVKWQPFASLALEAPLTAWPSNATL